MTAAIAIIPLLTWCCFAALAIYAGNVEEFSVGFAEMLFVYVPIAALLAGLLGLPAAFLGETGLSRYRAMLGAVAVAAWLQANILVWDYGALDGRSIDWLDAAWRGVFDLAIWVALIVFAVRGHQRFGKLLVAAAELPELDHNEVVGWGQHTAVREQARVVFDWICDRRFSDGTYWCGFSVPEL